MISNLCDNNKYSLKTKESKVYTQFLEMCGGIFDVINLIADKNSIKYYKAYNIKEKRYVCLKMINKIEMQKQDFELLLKKLKKKEK